MFGIFKRRKDRRGSHDLAQNSEAACVEVKQKWLQFHTELHLKPGVSLAQKIDLFSQPLHQFFEQKYPELLADGSEVFWLTIFTAILESGTHPKESVNAAVAQLEEKYSPSRQRERLQATLSKFLVEAKMCASEMSDNAAYIEKELPNVTMTDRLREQTARLCASLHVTSQNAARDIDAWLDGNPRVEELATRAHAIISRFSHDLYEMHVVVTALQAQSDIDMRFGGASLLVGESATNILKAHNQAGKAADAITAITKG